MRSPNNHDRTQGWLSSLFRRHEHHEGHPLDTALESSRQGIRAVKLSLVGLTVTALVQLAVTLLTSSVALLSDTLHNLADAASALPVWLAFSIGRREANQRFTHGYGRAEDLAGLVVVLMIAASAVAAAWQSIHRLLNPTPPRHLWAVALAAVLGAAGNEGVARYRIRVGRRIGSSALVADAIHARTDALTSIGVAIGAAGVALGAAVADPIAGLVIAAVIVHLLVEAARDVFARLLDAVDPDLVEAVRRTSATASDVIAVGDVRVRWVGHRLHAQVEITVPPQLSVADGHRIAEDVRHELLHTLPRLTHAIVHVDPDTGFNHDPHSSLAHHDRPAS